MGHEDRAFCSLTRLEISRPMEHSRELVPCSSNKLDGLC